MVLRDGFVVPPQLRVGETEVVECKLPLDAFLTLVIFGTWAWCVLVLNALLRLGMGFDSAWLSTTNENILGDPTRPIGMLQTTRLVETTPDRTIQHRPGEESAADRSASEAELFADLLS